MFKKVKEEIAKQTRADIGFAKTKNAKGLTIKTTNVPPVVGESSFHWTKRSYYQDRMITTTVPAPVLDVDIYEREWGGKFRYLLHYYWFWDMGWNNHNVQQIDGGITGAFEDINFYHDMNVLYGTTITGNGTEQSVAIKIEPITKTNITRRIGTIACTIWADVANINSDGSISSERKCVFSSGIQGLPTRVDIVLMVPVGESHTNLYILCYGHNEYLEHVNPFNSNGRELLGSHIKVVTDFRSKSSITYGASDNVNYDAPSWGDIPIVSSVDSVTGNIINTLSFTKPSSLLWDEYSVYRRFYSTGMSIDSTLDNIEFPNNIVLETSDASLFPAGSFIQVNGE